MSSHYNDDKATAMAKRLKELREKKELSHEKLANELREKCGLKISRDILIKYEVAARYHDTALATKGMKAETLYCLAEYFGVSTDYLLGKTIISDPRPEMRAVCKFTGLSEEAINAIQNINKGTDSYYYDTLGFKPPLLKIHNYLCGIGFTSELTKILGRCLYEVIIRKNYYERCHNTEQEQSIMLPALGYLNKELEDEIKRVIGPLMREFEDYYTSGGNGYDEEGNNLCSIQPRK